MHTPRPYEPQVNIVAPALAILSFGSRRCHATFFTHACTIYNTQENHKKRIVRIKKTTIMWQNRNLQERQIHTWKANAFKLKNTKTMRLDQIRCSHPKRRINKKNYFLNLVWQIFGHDINKKSTDLFKLFDRIFPLQFLFRRRQQPSVHHILHQKPSNQKP